MTKVDNALEALRAYARALRDDLRANPEVDAEGSGLELLLAPRFRSLVECLVGIQFSDTSLPLPRVLPEYQKAGIGRPDLAIVTPGKLSTSFIELKSPEKPIDPKLFRGHDRQQFARFKELPLLGFSNFSSARLYSSGRLIEQVDLVPGAVVSRTASNKEIDQSIQAEHAVASLRFVEHLVLAELPPPRNAKAAAHSLAHAARLVRELVFELVCNNERPASVRDSAPLIQVREEFRDVLFAKAKAGGYDDDGSEFDRLFASAFAQTLAFGLLLAREASGQVVDSGAHRLLAAGTYPLLKVTLQALLQPQVADDLGAILSVLLDTVNSIDPAVIVQKHKEDPILYFYEDFLGVFDPADRARHGVYFTPIPVVQFMIKSVNDTLINGLECDGLLDPNVLILDPACGTGTFLIAAANEIGKQAAEKYGEGTVAAELLSLSSRLFGFELLVGAYTVAHYRLHRELSSHGVQLTNRLPIYLSDTLAPPGDARRITGHIPFIDAPIVSERREADAVKASVPILAVIGNPPYRRLRDSEVEELVGPWMAELWDDLKKPVRDAGQGLRLNAFADLYLAFYRWALWKLFDRENSTGRGIVCFITNRSFLNGPTHAGLRKMLRDRFEEIRIVDLRGDSKASLPAGIDDDENVFAIQVGVCILWAWTKTPKGKTSNSASIQYCDVFEHDAYTREQKLELLNAFSNGTSVPRFHEVDGVDMDDFRPGEAEFDSLISLKETFDGGFNGVVTYRDHFSYSFSREELAARIRQFLLLSPSDASELFHNSALNKSGDAQKIPFQESYIRQTDYRPFDRRFLYAQSKYVDRLRRSLQETWGDQNVGLMTLAKGVGAGPSVWVYSSMPDQHAFRGSYGGYIFPLSAAGQVLGGSNFNPKFVGGLAKLYGEAHSAETIFNAIVCLLSAPAYANRFGNSLESDVARVPFPKAVDIFNEAAALGLKIRNLQTFKCKPTKEFQKARVVGDARTSELELPQLRHAYIVTSGAHGDIPLQSESDHRVVGVSHRAWSLSVSGYPIIYKWLEHRKGRILDRDFYRDLLDVIARTEALCHLYDKADKLLVDALKQVVVRTDLGFSE